MIDIWTIWTSGYSVEINFTQPSRTSFMIIIPFVYTYIVQSITAWTATFLSIYCDFCEGHERGYWTDILNSDCKYLHFNNFFFAIYFFQIPETEGASLAASHGVGFCEVSVAENSPNLYKVFEKLLVESRARPVKPRKFSVSKMIGKSSWTYIKKRTIHYKFFNLQSGTLIGNNGTRQPLVNQGTVQVCNKGELQNKNRLLKRRQAFTTAASLWPSACVNDDNAN